MRNIPCKRLRISRFALMVFAALAALSPVNFVEAQSLTPATMSAGQTNGVYNASTCGTSAAPSWCSGSDVGAWINAACTAGQNGNADAPVRIILDPHQTYAQTTRILKPLGCGINGQGSIITWSALSGAAIVVGVGANNLWNVQPIENLQVSGPGNTNMSNAAIAIFIGGDPNNTLNTVTAVGANSSFYNINISGFAVGYTWGNNVWALSCDRCSFHDNKVGVLAPCNGGNPGDVSNSGEMLHFTHSSFADNNSYGFQGCDPTQVVSISQSNIDYNATPFGGTGGNWTLSEVHVEGPGTFAISLSGEFYMRVYDSTLALSGSTGTTQALFDVRGSGSYVTVRDFMLTSFHALTDIVYTNGLTIKRVCVANPIWAYPTNTRPLPTYTDFNTVNCT